MKQSNLSKSDLLSHAKDVLDLEIAGLTALRDQLGETFVSAVDLILGCQGRVIISGMGKSGHIGRKIAATLSSTGTPAMFVHPAEAGHGDLGMITRQDVILAISNSGESKELEAVLIYAKRAKIPLISVTAKSNSTLGMHGDILLQTPDAKEACPLELAPTTSTTIALALGDALSVALMKARGFTPNDFGQFHPSGKLGAQLRTAAEVVKQNGHAIPLVKPDTSMRDVLMVMTEFRLGCTGVVDQNDALVGIVTDGDLRRSFDDPQLLDKTAADIMAHGPVVVQESTLAVEILNLMEERRITAVFVVRSQQPVGIIHLHDLLQNRTA
ncbi:MAG: KpsF/GutQ family sugar-phosphate isomerase [Alphaproteobacteria bacterium]